MVPSARRQRHHAAVSRIKLDDTQREALLSSSFLTTAFLEYTARVSKGIRSAIVPAAYEHNYDSLGRVALKPSPCRVPAEDVYHRPENEGLMLRSVVRRFLDK